MSAAARFRFGIVYDESGATQFTYPGGGGFYASEFSTAGGAWMPRRFTIAAGEKRVVWSYDQIRDFELLMLLIPSGGYLQCAYLVDTPAAADDLDPSGLFPRWRQFELSCKVPFLLNTDEAKTNTTLATEVGSDGDGLPAVFGHADTDDAKVYKLAVYNPDDEDDVVLDVLVAD